MNQYEAVIKTIEKLGGVATLGQLNQKVFEITNCKWGTKTPFATIRRIVQTRREIYKIKPGLYGLKKYKNQNEDKGIIEETEKNKDNREMIEFNHSYYQGLLLAIGKLKDLQTFVPNQDKNNKFLDKELGELRTLNEIPCFSYSSIVRRSRTVDVIWFNKREMPDSFFEIEHSTDIQSSLLKFNDLQDFHVNMLIVADKKRKNEYKQKIEYSSFKDINQRVKFLAYDSLVKQYEFYLEKSNFEVTL